jgi:hypothetical protein
MGCAAGSLTRFFQLLEGFLIIYRIKGRIKVRFSTSVRRLNAVGFGNKGIFRVEKLKYRSIAFSLGIEGGDLNGLMINHQQIGKS